MPVLARLIVNPVAGAGRAMQLLPRVLAALRAEGQRPEVLETRGPGDAERLAASAPARGALAVMGGDGTLNGVINGLRGRDIPIALLPCGSGNDTARGLGVPRHPVTAARVLAGARETSIDLGEIAGRLFCNVAGVGLDGEVCRLLATGAIAIHGHPAYVAAFLLTAANLRASGVCMQADDGAWRELNALMISFANGPYYGGGMRIAPAADPQDGLLDICTVLAIGRLALLRAFPRVYLGRHVTHPRFRLSRAGELRLYGRRPLWLHADGERAGRLSRDPAHPTLVRIAGQRQRFLIPSLVESRGP